MYEVTLEEPANGNPAWPFGLKGRNMIIMTVHADGKVTVSVPGYFCLIGCPKVVVFRKYC
jgi:hypothetical protein